MQCNRSGESKIRQLRLSGYCDLPITTLRERLHCDLPCFCEKLGLATYPIRSINPPCLGGSKIRQLNCDPTKNEIRSHLCLGGSKIRQLRLSDYCDLFVLNPLSAGSKIRQLYCIVQEDRRSGSCVFQATATYQSQLFAIGCTKTYHAFCEQLGLATYPMRSINLKGVTIKAL